MRQVPHCLNRRYKAMDELIQELSMKVNSSRTRHNDSSSPDETAIRLMCDFWKILEDEPKFNLTEAIQQKLGVDGISRPNQNAHANDLLCYVVNNCGSKKDCCDKEVKRPSPPKSTSVCCDIPLSEVLCCLREASICDQNCEVIMKELLSRQVELDEQIKILEKKQEAGAKLLKEADCMWTTMEEMYKAKLAEHTKKAKELTTSVKEIEESRDKWRKNKIDLEAQMKEIKSFVRECLDKINNKTKDLVTLETEVDCHKKKAEVNKLTLATLQDALNKKQAESEDTINSINKDVEAIEKEIQRLHSEKDEKIHGPLKKDRDEMQKYMSQFLQVQLELADIVEQKKTILEEIEMHKQRCEDCKSKCDVKKHYLENEIKRIDGEINSYKLKCTRCAVGTDTSVFHKFCNDCSYCAKMKECHVGDETCSVDETKACVCTSTKFKFLDNVFENMYTILEKQSRTKTGKDLANSVLTSLKNSKNGKVDEQTKAQIKDFVIDLIKNNINMTIIGGAIKTRCEMSPETHQQLMSCLKTIKISSLEDKAKEDKATTARKDPCQRWKKYTECQCTKGPKGCVCQEFQESKVSKDEEKSNKVILTCPHRGSKANQEAPKQMTLGGCVSCPFTKEGKKKSHCVMTAAADIMTRTNNIELCDSCNKMEYTNDWIFSLDNVDDRQDTLGNLIEDVVGPYSDVTPLEKVSFTAVKSYR